MKRSAKLKMTNLWSQCAKKISQPILLFLLGWWSWHALVQERLCMVFRSWQAANLPKWSSTSQCQDFRLTTPWTSFMIMPARESEKSSAARRPRWIEMFLRIPRVFAGCPAGVPAYLKLFEWSLIEHTFLSFLLSSSSPPPKIFSSKLYSPFLFLFSSPSKKNLLIIIVRFFLLHICT